LHLNKFVQLDRLTATHAKNPAQMHQQLLQTLGLLPPAAKPFARLRARARRDR
jgi:hypothetical protein